MQREEKIILNSGNIVQSIISFIRDIRKKHNLSKDKLVLYIDMFGKDIELSDIDLIKWEKIISKFNIGNLEKIEYSLEELFEKNIYFESFRINKYNIYLGLPSIEKKLQVNDFTNEINRIEKQKKIYQNKLLNENFITKAPKDIVEVEQKKLIDSENRIENLKANMLMLTCGKEYYNLLLKFGSNEKINWHIQYQRELKSKNKKYNAKWFNEVYNPEINSGEIKELYSKVLYK